MTCTRTIAMSTLAAGVAVAGLIGLGTGTAAAQPNPCGGPGQVVCQPGNPGPNHPPMNQRGIDQGRQDHQPFMYQGHQVTPMRAGNGNGWGFWFLGQWIGL
ncbi:hypothetical protein BVC93_28745 [Mycobacterium sp. MS1601]|uniref:hypothetical protein n=1 Tax=Mycobacterium sp. MS1601 TaxID=1936029 RepID=UPI00097915C5|nr:hypothetical protein [Mycobacterium sp. MS1601]AQA05696.1 hypothetical protein BVC93_28745 [Mycobacterium sp. MS1601]